MSGFSESSNGPSRCRQASSTSKRDRSRPLATCTNCRSVPPIRKLLRNLSSLTRCVLKELQTPPAQGHHHLKNHLPVCRLEHGVHQGVHVIGRGRRRDLFPGG